MPREGVRLGVVHRLSTPASPVSFLARNAWKVGLGVLLVVTSRGVSQPTVHHLTERALALSSGPTIVQCGSLPSGTTVWTSAGSPYILPGNDPNLGTGGADHPNCLKTDPTSGQKVPDDVYLPANGKLVIDGSQGSVQIFSHGTGITVTGGEIQALGSIVRDSQGNITQEDTIGFDAEPDVASWDGIKITTGIDPTSGRLTRGQGAFAYTSIQHALTAIQINSGSTGSSDIPSYGLTVVNSGIGPSYFDGIDATNTPISVTGRIDPKTGRSDGQFGTLNNIGSQGIKVTFDPAMPNFPAVIPAKSLDVENMTFGSSVPFAETNCPPLTSCAAGTIGNDAIQATFAANAQEPVLMTNNQFFRAGFYGLELTNANNPAITNNIFTCNGSGSPTPIASCVGTGLRYSAIYLSNVTNLSFAAEGLNNNKGQQNGLDAIVLNGHVVTDLPWQTPTNDSNAPSLQHPPHALGYMVANGDLEVLNSTLTVLEGDVVKVKGGAILLTNGTLDAASGLDANGHVSTAPKTFTSMRDNGVGIQACPSVFVQSCPAPVPSNEWIGIDLSASKARIDNANILFPTKAVDVSGSSALITGPDAGLYSLVLTNSRIGPTFSDSVSTEGRPIYVASSVFCTIDATSSDPNYGHCTGPGPGNRAINASYVASDPAQGGLKILRNDFRGSVNEAIRGVGLNRQAVDVENNNIQNAGAIGSAKSAGIYLQGADNPRLQTNQVVASGTGSLHYPAIWLDGVSNADFSGLIRDNTGSGNGLNAIAFHGDSKTLNWQTVGASGQLGFIVDGNLLVAGDLTLVSGDYAPVLTGTITVQNGTLTSTGAVLTSLKEQTAILSSCGSVFVPRISGVCAPTSAGDWGGLVLDPGTFDPGMVAPFKTNRLTDSEIRYAVTGISMRTPSGPRLTQNLILKGTSIRNTASDGLNTFSPVSITGGAFTNNHAHAIKIDLTDVVPSSLQPLSITGNTTIGGSGQDGILAVGLAGQTVQIEQASVDHAGAFGINLKDAGKQKYGTVDGHLTLKNNTVTNTAATFPAIYLNDFTGPFATISGNRGAANGVNAIAFHGSVMDDLTWITAR